MAFSVRYNQRAIVFGLVLGLATCALCSGVLDQGQALAFLGVIIATVVGMYLALGWRSGQRGLLEESVHYVIFVAVLTQMFVGNMNAKVLAMLYFAHGCWDLLHCVGVLGPHIPSNLLHFCVSYDWVVAAYIWFYLSGHASRVGSLGRKWW